METTDKVLRQLKLSKGWKIACAVLIALCALLAAVLFWFALTVKTRSALIALVITGLVSLFLLVYLIAFLKRYRIMVQGTLITCCDAFSTRTIDLAQFDHFRITSSEYVNGICFYADGKTKMKNTVYLYFSEREEFIEHLESYLGNSNMEETQHEFERIAQDERLGDTDAERMKKVASAHRANRILFWAALGIVVLSFVFTKYHKFSVVILTLMPFLLLLAVPFSRGAIRFDDKANSLYPSVLRAFLVPVCGLPLWALAYNIVNWKLVVLPALCFTGALFYAVRLIERNNKMSLLTALLLLIFCCAYGTSAAIVINDLGTRKVYELYNIEIREKHESKDNQYFIVAPWGNRPAQNKVNVTKRNYNAHEVYDTAQISVYSGLLKIQFYIAR